MNGDQIIAICQMVLKQYEKKADAIEALDRAIGDGDHVINMKRGMAKIVEMETSFAGLNLEEGFKKIALALLSGIGGASGPLFASLFMGMAKPGPDTFAQRFATGVADVQKRGKAREGEKTMLDVLIPVSSVFTALEAQGATIGQILKTLKETAQKGAENTRNMEARKGRASFLGERSIGTVDPGARSCEVIISTICDCLSDGEIKI